MKAIDFKLKNTNDKEFTLDSFKNKKLVIFFYPKANTSGCTNEALNFKEKYDEFLKRGYDVIGISKDKIKANKKFKDQYDFPFELLSDETTEICQKYQVYKEKSMYGRKYMGVERTTFILDENKNIVKRFDKVKIKNHVDDVLNFIDGL